MNVLIALVDRDHQHHDYAHQWVEENSASGWSSCAITENGVIRIISNSNYPNSMKSPAHAAAMLAELKEASAHQFWHESVSVLDSGLFRLEHVTSPKQITDIYLLGLAVRHGGHFVTFDRHINPQAVLTGKNALRILRP